VDLELVWKTIHGDLPMLYRQVKQVLDDLPRVDNNSDKTP
jgi:uncharacterized protein with HEPN domain